MDNMCLPEFKDKKKNIWLQILLQYAETYYSVIIDKNEEACNDMLHSLKYFDWDLLSSFAHFSDQAP